MFEGLGFHSFEVGFGLSVGLSRAHPVYEGFHSFEVGFGRAQDTEPESRKVIVFIPSR